MSASAAGPRTLYDKVFDAHVVDILDDGETCLLYIDRHLVHEVTSPQAFEGLRMAGRRLRRTDCTLATVDHNIPTTSRAGFRSTRTFVHEPESRLQCTTLEANVREFGVTYFGLDDGRQGIVHVIGPEQGFTLPGTTVVCGDSHTSTHGAFGALAFGIGTSEVEHVLATQTLLARRSRNMRVQVDGTLPPGVTSKDLVLHIIGVIGTAGGTGCVIEFCGEAVRALSMEARMSMCNMSIEAGARAGMVAPDEITFDYLHGRPLAPSTPELWDSAIATWTSLRSDPDAKFDIDVRIDAESVSPTTGHVPDPATAATPTQRAAMENALEYMALVPGTPMTDIKIDKVFIGSCTNSRIEDLRAAARIVRGRHVAPNVKAAMVVPGSVVVKRQAEAEGLDRIFKEAGFDWREAGCSMCLGMNPDQLSPGERCASTSNRNFKGRQGPGGRTHLMSPAMAAAAGIAGHLADVREFSGGSSTERATRTVELEGDGAGTKRVKTDSDADSAVWVELDGRDYLDAQRGFVGSAGGPAAEGEDEPAGEVADAGAAGSSGGIQAFRVLRGTAAYMDVANVDTDMIIPKQFLKTIKRTGLSGALFYELRYDVSAPPGPNGQLPERPEFVLNQPAHRARHHSILLAGANFGCGSSREHAPWALLDYGVRCVVAESFADIFFNNCFKNMVLPVVLPRAAITALAAAAAGGAELEVDLEARRVRAVGGGPSLEFAFEVDELRRTYLLNGWDEISVTLQRAAAITRFEVERVGRWPWLDAGERPLREKSVVVPALPAAAKPARADW